MIDITVSTLLRPYIYLLQYCLLSGKDISAYIPAQHSLNIELKCCAQH